MLKIARIKHKNLQILTSFQLNRKGRSASIMDINNLPIGFVMGMSMKKDAMDAYSELTEAEKEEIINECRDAKSKSEMERIIDRLSGKWF